ncbi:hypothetical protein GCM10023221_20920 [Luteimicrobium xylanilyticum]
MVPRLREAPAPPRAVNATGLCGFRVSAVLARRGYARVMAKTWEYATIPLIIHNTKAVLDQWGADGWELVQVVTGPDGNGLVAYLKRPTGE